MRITNNKFQNRYLAHQKHKKVQLTSNYGENPPKKDAQMKNKYKSLIKERRSQRLFNSIDITTDELKYILSCIAESPSSCNRQAIQILCVRARNEKEILGGLLVGGVGWCHRANIIFLLFADPEAYKEKLEYMPYLDAGVITFNTYLACETIRVGCCFINPNIRLENKDHFEKQFGKKIFCGALAIGHYSKKSKYSPKIDTSELVL